MNIIIEGPDCVGKSTLAKNIIAKYNLQYYHCEKPPKIENQKEYEINYYQDLIKNSKNTIFDRFHLGCQVYGNLCRNYNDFKIIEKIENFEMKDWFLILLIDEPQRLIKRDIERNDNQTFFLDVESKRIEIEYFKYAFEMSKCKKIIIDISDKNINDVKNISLDFLSIQRNNNVK